MISVCYDNPSPDWRRACAATLAGLPEMSPRRLSNLLNDVPPEVAWEMLAKGDCPPACRGLEGEQRSRAVASKWAKVVKRTDPMVVLERYSDLGVSVWCQLDSYPVCLVSDPAPPAVLFWQGTEAPLSRPRVAIIGTRHATHAGRDIARRFGAELSEAGVSVVSGLALGIDAAAHEGALQAAFGAEPLAVVGNGLDSVYPRRHSALWNQVRESGLLVTEAPLGAPPEPWRFPARNRIMAGMADAVVVVESHETGGSLLTVNEALERAVPVFAVPGSIHSPASRGTNNLLRDGSTPVCSTEDILFALSVESCRYEPDQAGAYPVDEVDLCVLEALDWEPTSLDKILLRTGRSPGAVAVALTRLANAGVAMGHNGFWQRVEGTSSGPFA